MHVALGVLLALWGAFFVLFSRRMARGQHPRGRFAARLPSGGAGPHPLTTAMNAAIGAALVVCGALLGLGVL
jgi:hypothetical protein